MANIEKSRLTEIIRLHNELKVLCETALEKALRIGQLLTEQKTILNHGDWSTWAENNLPFTIRTATNYMNIYQNQKLLKSESVSDLTSAYRLLEAPKVDHQAIKKRIARAYKLKDDSARFREFASIKKKGYWGVPLDSQPSELIWECHEQITKLLTPAKGYRIFGFAPTKQAHIPAIPQANNLFVVKPVKLSESHAKELLTKAKAAVSDCAVTIDELMAGDDLFCVTVLYVGTFRFNDAGNVTHGINQSAKYVHSLRLIEWFEERIDIANMLGFISEPFDSEEAFGALSEDTNF